MDEGVELAVLAAGVDSGRQVAQQGFIEAWPAGEGGVEGLGVRRGSREVTCRVAGYDAPARI